MQDVIIIILIWYYERTKTSWLEIIIVTILLGSYSFFLFTNTILNHQQWDLIMSTSVMLNLITNGNQALQNCMARSTG